ESWSTLTCRRPLRAWRRRDEDCNHTLKPLRSRVGPQPSASNHCCQDEFQSDCTMGLVAAGQRGALARPISQALSPHRAVTWLKWPGGIEWSLNGSQARWDKLGGV